MKLIKRTFTSSTLLCLLAVSVFAQEAAPKTAAPQSEAKLALEKLKSLAGSWQGEIMRIPITFSIRAASSGTAVVHEGNTEGGGPPSHEITMFYIDGDRLLSTHYCDAGNRSNLDGKMSADGKTIKFSFIEVIGSKRGGYLKDMALTIVDAKTHIIEVNFVMPDGAAIPLRGEFKRTP
ncbi:MAG TPA: hypothetical protein VK934_05335 [Fimbriimonas sp.]|nr:hypothetical protein [Fimbriimonas sp.]